jgi:hypothetical protein
MRLTCGDVGDGAGKEEDKPGLLTLLVEDCLKNPYVWLFAISYFFVYVVRQGVTSWFIFYLKVGAGKTICASDTIIRKEYCTRREHNMKFSQKYWELGLRGSLF